MQGLRWSEASPLHCNRLLGPSHPAERAAVELFHRTRQSLTLRAG
ncbi:hypothetical protein [Streptomyces mirabilis]